MYKDKNENEDNTNWNGDGDGTENEGQNDPKGAGVLLGGLSDSERDELERFRSAHARGDEDYLFQTGINTKHTKYWTSHELEWHAYLMARCVQRGDFRPARNYFRIVVNRLRRWDAGIDIERVIANAERMLRRIDREEEMQRVGAREGKL